MVPGFDNTGHTIEDYWRLYTRRESVIMDNISVTVEWDHTNRIKY